MKKLAIPKIPWRKAVSTIAACALAFSFVPIPAAMADVPGTAQASVSRDEGTRYDYDSLGLGNGNSWYTYEYSITTKGGLDADAICISPTKHAPGPGKYTFKEVSGNKTFSTVIFYGTYKYIKAYNDSVTDPADKLQSYWQAKGLSDEYSKAQKWIITHVAASMSVPSSWTDSKDNKIKEPFDQDAWHINDKCRKEAEKMVEWAKDYSIPSNTGIKFAEADAAELVWGSTFDLSSKIKTLTDPDKGTFSDPQDGDDPAAQHMVSKAFIYEADDRNNTLRFDLPDGWTLQELKGGEWSSTAKKFVNGKYVTVATGPATDVQISPRSIPSYNNTSGNYRLVSTKSVAEMQASNSFPSDFALNFTPRSTRNFKCYVADNGVLNDQVLAFIDWTNEKPTVSMSGTTPEPNYVEIQKDSANHQITDGNSCYSLEGAVYELRGSINGTETLLDTVTLNASGYGISGPIFYTGDVAAVETTAPKGYANGGYNFISSPYRATLTANEEGADSQTITINTLDRPQNDPIKMIFSKATTETGEAATMEGASRENAIYRVDYYDQETTGPDAENCLAQLGGRAPKDTYTLKTDKKGAINWNNLDKHLVEGVAQGTLYKNNDNEYCLPIGTVIIQEVTPPYGYNLNLAKYVIHITSANNPISPIRDVWTAADAEGFVDDEPWRRDLELTKDEEGTEQVFANVPFLLTARATGESHVVVTDSNGFWSSATSWTPHTTKTNASDAAVDIKVKYDEDKGYYTATGKVTDKSKLVSRVGCYFGTQDNGTVATPDNDRPALPTGVYDLQELRVDENDGAQLIHRTITIDREQRLTFEGEAMPHWNGCDQLISLNLDDTYPEISTYVREKSDNDQVVFCDTESVVIDFVEYFDLIKGANYVLKTALVNAADGTAITNADGSAIEFSTPFVPKRTGGTQQIEMKLDTTGLAGKRILVTERLYDASGNEVAAEVWDNGRYNLSQCFDVKGQKIGTTLVDAADGDHSVPVDGKITLTDTVQCTNLIPGREYTVYGTLMSATTATDGHVSAQPLKRLDGSTVTASAKFTAPDDNPCLVDVTFTFDAVDAGLFQGGKVVAYERLYLGDRLVATHEDPSDPAQTVAVTSADLGTTATDSDGDQVIAPELVKATDTVEYRGLKAGQEYTMTATVWVKGATADGTTTQTQLLDAAGKAVTGSVTFKPNDSYGTVKVPVTFDASALADGAQLVFFEECTGNGATVALHADINDAGQTLTVQYPKMATVAFDGTSSLAEPTLAKSIAADASSAVSDKIAYANLNCDGKHTYTFLTLLMDAATGMPVSIDGTDTAAAWAAVCEALGLTQTDHLVSGTVPVSGVSAEAVTDLLSSYDMAGKMVWGVKEITPEKASGDVTVTLPIDASNLADKSIVVYELMFSSATDALGAPTDSLMAAEIDAANPEQTVTVGGIKIGTTASRSDKDGGKRILRATKAEVTDTVEFSGLVPNTEYTLVGTLYNRATEKPYLVDDEEVTVTQSFTPRTENGKVNVYFTFDSTQLKKDDELVVFEKLFKSENGEDIEIAAHEDINSDEQTVVVSGYTTDIDEPEPDTRTNTPMDKTGASSILWIVAVTLLAAGGSILVFTAVTGRREKAGTAGAGKPGKGNRKQ